MHGYEDACGGSMTRGSDAKVGGRGRERGTHLLALALVLLVPLGSACVAARPSPGLDAQVDRILADRHERLAAARADFARRTPLPRIDRFPGGTIVLERVELVGAMGMDYVRLRISYVNETEQTFDRVHLHFQAKDGFGRVRARNDVAFVMPLDYRFTPGTSYSDEVHLPTGGAHETPGWDVVVGLDAEVW